METKTHVFQEEIKKETMIYVKCKRCGKKREVFSYWCNNIRLKLCKVCRDYNKAYLKKINC